jgi:glutamine cyclotransferase
MHLFFINDSMGFSGRRMVALLGLLSVILGAASARPEGNNTAVATTEPPRAEQTAPAQSPEPVPVYTYRVVKSYPHDPHAFTQGLLFEQGCFYESTGRYGESSVRKVEISTGTVIRLRKLPARYFGEGLTAFQDKLVQLTWRSRIGFVYDKERFARLKEFAYPTEGWGLTHDGKQLIMSDGSSTLYFRDPETFEEIDAVQVYDREVPVSGLNELEYIRGEIYANVFPSDRIARIDPLNGQVKAWVDLSGLLSVERRNPEVQVLNGIAYDSQHDRLFVTGKLWPRVFEIEIIPVD